MPQACSHQDADEDVEEKWFKLLCLYLLLLVETLHQQVAEQQSHEPTGGVIANGQGTQMRQDGVWVPYDIVE